MLVSLVIKSRMADVFPWYYEENKSLQTKQQAFHLYPITWIYSYMFTQISKLICPYISHIWEVLFCIDGVHVDLEYNQ